MIRFKQRPSLHNGRTQILNIVFLTPDSERWSDHLSTTAVGGFNPLPVQLAVDPQRAPEEEVEPVRTPLEVREAAEAAAGADTGAAAPRRRGDGARTHARRGVRGPETPAGAPS